MGTIRVRVEAESAVIRQPVAGQQPGVPRSPQGKHVVALPPSRYGCTRTSTIWPR